MAATGHAGTHAPQSMHSSGWIYSIVACANSGSSFRGWIQSTGQTSTQAVSFVSMHGSVMMNGMSLHSPAVKRSRRDERDPIANAQVGAKIDQPSPRNIMGLGGSW